MLTMTKELVIRLVPEEEMDPVEIDEQVVERVKQLGHAACPSPGDKHPDFVYFQPKPLQTRTNEFSYLEKKYRVDYANPMR